MNITLEESLSLEAELAGFRDHTGVVMQGVLAQKLPISVKYHLSQLLKQVADDRKFLNDETASLREKLGTEEEIIEIAKDPKHPANIDFQLKMRKFLVETIREIKISDSLSVADFNNVETTEYYPVLFKLLEN